MFLFTIFCLLKSICRLIQSVYCYAISLYVLQVCVLNGGHVGPVQCVQFNPVYMMMASACSHVNLWLPKTEDKNNGGKE